uniref:Uncharacterized protein n=1 Tax=Arundo donax TaxID=35708 RepID=A0A0A9FEB1_ARUDO
MLRAILQIDVLTAIL